MLKATIQGDFWEERLLVNARQAIFHQWDQLEASGCIENFRIAAGQKEGFRAGWFFADSDAYKWLEAASRVLAHDPNPKLAALVDGFTGLLGNAQSADGYLFTYNQIHFPGTRWQNLQIEHELYCHGHLIEAGVSHHEVTGQAELLDIARKAADRIVADFRGKGPADTPGHEEIEIALLRLHQAIPDCQEYLQLARQFIEQRGRNRLFGLSLLRQDRQVGARTKFVQQKLQEYTTAHPGFKPYQLPLGNRAKKAPHAKLRWNLSGLSGKYFQQHAPIRKQTVPVGHSVRFAYLETAVAMLAQESGDRSLLPALQQAWERMVTRRMYVTGGIGSLPGIEGFGNDDELDPAYAYAETCAALASLFWNWEMAQLTGEAKYSELFEWQLYNAAAVGMGLDGTSYLYNNPLTCEGGVERRPWYAVPCCPSNLSRTWANLGKYIFSATPEGVRVHQYISSQVSGLSIPLDGGESVRVSLAMESGFPWEGRVQIRLTDAAFSNAAQPAPFAIQLRQPAWSGGDGDMAVWVNGEPAAIKARAENKRDAPASGYDPRPAAFQSFEHPWAAGDVVEVRFEMPVQLRRARPSVSGHRGKVAVTRGPLVYCLEDVDQPKIDIFAARLEPDSLIPVYTETLLGGAVRLQGKTTSGEPLTFIPYFLWGNRGPSKMTVWVNA